MSSAAPDALANPPHAREGPARQSAAGAGGGRASGGGAGGDGGPGAETCAEANFPRLRRRGAGGWLAGGCAFCRRAVIRSASTHVAALPTAGRCAGARNLHEGRERGAIGVTGVHSLGDHIMRMEEERELVELHSKTQTPCRREIKNVSMPGRGRLLASQIGDVRGAAQGSERVRAALGSDGEFALR